MDYEKKYKNALTIAQSRFKIEKDKSVLTCLVMMFPELRESENERIRKFIYDYIADSYWMKDWNVSQEECLAYLEKQEQKPMEKPSKEECITKFKVLCDAYDIKLPNREYDIYGLCEDLHKFFGDIQKPAEWSEVDENQAIKDIIPILKDVAYQGSFGNPNQGTMLGFARRILKSLRPSWKPSEEQMEALKECGECKRCIKELREQLEK